MTLFFAGTPMQVVSFFNLSGGVGKTTLTREVAYSIAKRGYRVLAIDMDPQKSLTNFCGLGEHELTSYEMLMKGEDAIARGVSEEGFEWGFDIVPSHPRLAVAEKELTTARASDFRLKKFLGTKQDNYDFVLVDCPPSIANLSYVSLVASTFLVVPIQTESKAFDGTDIALAETVAVVDEGVNPKLRIGCFVPTLYSGGIGQHREVFKRLQPLKDIAPVLQPIPKAIAISDAAAARLPLEVYLKRRKREVSNNEKAALKAIGALVDVVEGFGNA